MNYPEQQLQKPVGQFQIHSNITAAEMFKQRILLWNRVATSQTFIMLSSVQIQLCKMSVIVEKMHSATLSNSKSHQN